MRTGFLALAALLSGCTSLVNPTAMPLSDESIQTEFGIAQRNVAIEYDHPRAWTLEPDDFKWIPMDGPFQCGEETADGCYSTRSNTISYNIHTPWSIRHEAGHAILYKLGDPRWKCYGHTC